MANENGALDATLAAAAGDNAALLGELRHAFLQSAEKHLDLLKRSRCDGNWNVAAHRLKGLAASFHAQELLDAADNALNCAPGEPMAVREIERVLARFSGKNSLKF
ncbi:Hpt domain-containing protein [Erythrobacter sp. SCSIO 43205]|uniref:Hpt domain-containing protein n=1 Tax=Erythrobacter sp. SCSIO 43205 TaxID=2779361 RepID=UPI001CA7D03C|nr:Hpt domain-containing protein [Erythrobacter sp. SCSIO 43205]UAB77229.1 Hpt domain-containing protein [Erythrobacter sp. SCSIO 43205]